MDDFSFPTAAADPDSLCRLPFPHFAASPLWFVHHHRRSFSSDTEAASKIADVDSLPLSNDVGGGRFLDEDRMDMLWEDFNEELYRVSCDGKREAKEGARGEAGTGATDTGKHDDAVEVCCVQALGVSGGGGGLLHHRRPSLVMLLKVLKKLFLIQKTSSSRSSVQMGMGRSKS